MCGPWECRRGQDCACPLWGHPIVQDHSPGGMPNLSHHSWTQTQTPAALKAKGLWRWHRVFWANISWKSIHFFSAYVLVVSYLFIYLFGESEKKNPDQGFKLSLWSLTWDLISSTVRSWPEPNWTRKLAHWATLVPVLIIKSSFYWIHVTCRKPFRTLYFIA